MFRRAVISSLLIVTLLAAAWTESSGVGEEGRLIEALSAEQAEDLLGGQGMGDALAAEFNGYPGPLHVLALARETTVASLAGFLLSGAASGGGNLAVVERFIAAFNEHDVDGMLALTTNDVRWLSIDVESVSAETSGRDELRASMSAYFSDVPSARASLRAAAASGRFVHAVEEASWTSGGERRRQCSVAVYELERAGIMKVWYFPAHDCP